MARISLTSLLVALLGSGSLSLATANIASASTSSLPSSSTVAPAACTATSVSTLGGFFDLRPDIAVPAPKDAPKVKGVRNTDYEARGWDYGYNFTLNVCSSVVAPVKDVVGIEKSQWQNDFTTIIVASCARFLPASNSYGTAHYRRLARSPTRSREDENRLIDQLDEEWDD
ncbi:hypothetical protein CFO_g4618 [Ceratocystis platani]|uniref:Uncharacterized protein n=1 Tax=Ceratocystis fimbriata f. sp. platani TaxID=88771 RepID=A0A0F8DAC4_CERFI|nr:hypothetical protein CFO_g4618 [Ceratocystis platani]